MEEITIGEKLTQFAEGCAGDIYEAYSGRGMYGACCLGVSTDYKLDHDQLVELCKSCDLPAPSWDNLGLGMIYYWPSYEYLPAQD